MVLSEGNPELLATAGAVGDNVIWNPESHVSVSLFNLLPAHLRGYGTSTTDRPTITAVGRTLNERQK